MGGTDRPGGTCTLERLHGLHGLRLHWRDLRLEFWPDPCAHRSFRGQHVFSFHNCSVKWEGAIVYRREFSSGLPQHMLYVFSFVLTISEQQQ